MFTCFPTASREDLEKKKDASRVRIPKVLDTSVEESSSSEDEQQILLKETAKGRVSWACVLMCIF